MVSFMTLENSMDERKLKNYQAFVYTTLSSMTVCEYRAGPVCVCVWSGMGRMGGGRAVFSQGVSWLMREKTEREKETERDF